MQKNLHYKKYTYSKLKKKLKNKNFNQVKKFYNVFIKNYFTLNKKYLFNQEFDRSYILRQIKEIFKKKADSKRKIKMSLIPIGIKDNINTLDLDTKFGLRVRKRFRSGNNARVVSKIIDNPGIIFSKLTCAEFAVHHIDKKKVLIHLTKRELQEHLQQDQQLQLQLAHYLWQSVLKLQVLY